MSKCFWTRQLSIWTLDVDPAGTRAVLGEEVWAQHGRVVEQLQDRFPAAADDLLAFTAFSEHWRPGLVQQPLV